LRRAPRLARADSSALNSTRFLSAAGFFSSIRILLRAVLNALDACTGAQAGTPRRGSYLPLYRDRAFASICRRLPGQKPLARLAINAAARRSIAQNFERNCRYFPTIFVRLKIRATDSKHRTDSRPCATNGQFLCGPERIFSTAEMQSTQRKLFSAVPPRASTVRVLCGCGQAAAL
jgi:hypothetical protein